MLPVDMLPPALPLPQALQLLLWIRSPTQFMQACSKLYGPTFRVRPFAMPEDTPQVVVSYDPEVLRRMFASGPEEMYAGEMNVILRVALGTSSLLLLDGTEHLRHRRLLVPQFHGDRMRHYGQTMAAITAQAIDRFPKHAPFALHPIMQDITLRVILRTVFGVDESEDGGALKAQIERAMGPVEMPGVVLPMMHLSLHPERETRFPWRVLLRNRERLDRMLYARIAERRAMGPMATRHDVLSMLLEARDEHGEGMSDKELRDELLTALLAGHETTASSLAWAVDLIYRTPEVRERLLSEVRALGASPDPERLAALPYLDAAVKEVLRLRPVVPIVGRVLKRPLEVAGYHFEAGTPLTASIALAHMDPRVYPEPEAFRPERFMEAKADPSTYLPFGGGLRRCVGAAFAQYEMKIVLGTLLSSCDVELTDPRPERAIRRAVTLSPKRGTRVRVRPAAIRRGGGRREFASGQRALRRM